MPTAIAPVTPVLPVDVFVARRAEVMRRMRELVPGGGVLVLCPKKVSEAPSGRGCFINQAFLTVGLLNTQSLR